MNGEVAPDLQTTLVLRANATPTTGAGHVMRCLNLAEAWLGGAYGPVALNGEVSIPFVAERVASMGIAPYNATQFTDAVLVVDSYDSAVRQRCAHADDFRLRVLVDDLGETVPAGYDGVWNPNAYGSRSLYPGFDGAVLAGPGMVPVRSNLPHWTGLAAAPAIGVALGGGAPLGAVVDGIRAAADSLPDIEWVGAGTWVPEGWTRVDRAAPWSELVRCRAVLLASGIMIWEAAAVGVPVVAIRTAANQDRVAKWVSAYGVRVLDASALPTPAAVARAVLGALPAARSIPRIQPGGVAVARELHALAVGTEVSR